MTDPAGLALSSVALYVLALDSVRFLTDCAHFPDDARRLHSKCILQINLIEAWGKASGIAEGVVQPYLDEGAIRHILTEIHSITASTSTTINRYHLQLSNLPNPPPYPINHLVNINVSQDPAVISERLRQIDEIRQSTNWLRWFQWASWDKKRFGSLVNDLKDYSDALHKYLSAAQYEAFLLEKKLARAHQVSSSDLDRLRALEGAASDDDALHASLGLRITQLELELEFQQRLSAHQSTPRTYTRLEKAKLTGPSTFQHPPIMLSLWQYDGRDVVVEWKPYGSSSNRQNIERFERLRRVNALTHLLKQDKPEELRILRCLGFVDDNQLSQFGHVFEWPSGIPTAVKPHSLLHLIQQFKYPSLSDRLRLSFQLSGCIFELLTVGWYHKCIRPQNVIFFPEDREKLPDLHLMGFYYSRFAETTEQITEGELENPEFDIYRSHRQLIPNQPFSIDFDIYSFGLVLLVIAKWKKMEDIIKEFGIPADTPQKIWDNILSPGSRNRKKLMQDLRFRVGNIYADVVDWCLKETPAPTSGLETPFTFFQHVYKKLQALRQAV